MYRQSGGANASSETPNIHPVDQNDSAKNPQEIGGFSLPKEWRFVHGIEDFSEPEVHKIKHVGEITTQRFFMEDGSVYRVRDGRPKHQKIDQAIISTTAFLTRDDEGINPYIQEKEMESGFHSLLISRELEWEGDLSQARTAYNMLKISDQKLGDNDNLDPINRQAKGISRGGMLAQAMKAMSEASSEHKTHIYYLNSVAPCYARPLQVSIDYLKMPARESMSLIYHLGRLPVNVMLRYPHSLDLDPEYVWAGAKSLSNGDAGRLVKYIPEDCSVTRGHVSAYDDDIMGQGSEWQKDFKNHSGVCVDIKQQRLLSLFNGHLRVVCIEDLKEDFKRQDRLVEESRRTNGNISDIDFEYVNIDDRT